MRPTRHLARLQFEDGPIVEGEWTLPGTAEERYKTWIGRYDAHGPNVMIQLIDETDGRERVRRRWTAQGEVKDPVA